MVRGALLAGVLVALTLGSGEAKAQLVTGVEDNDSNGSATAEPFVEKPWHLGVKAGFGSSVGLIGFIGEFNVLNELTLGLGAGLNPGGEVFESHARVRPAQWRHRSGRFSAFMLEGAFSRARYASVLQFSPLSSLCEGSPRDPESRCYNPPFANNWVYWAQGEVGWETLSRAHFGLRVSAGVAGLIGPTPGCELGNEAVPCAEDKTADRWLPVASVAFSQGF